MKLVTFRSDVGERLGALVPEGVLDLAAAGAQLGYSIPGSMQQFIEGGPSAWDIARQLIVAKPSECIRRDASIAAPLPRPIRLRDASLFLEHMEASMARFGKTMNELFKQQIIYYNADHVHVYGPDADIPWPSASSWIDFELEWACIVGLGGANISKHDATSHIFGFTVFNDWSARDLQFPFMECNLGPGAGKDFANSLGPCIATLDEFSDPYALMMSARVNGEIWSTGTTASMFHRFEDAICQLSVDRPLVTGEVIGSGTVLGGCGFELDRRPALGDIVELEVEGIGILRNRVVASKTAA